MSITGLTAIELATAYADGELSPVEVTQAVLERIEEADAELGAYCLVDREGALAQAEESARRWSSGHPKGLLDGVPIAIKDIFLTAGWPTLRGSKTVDPGQEWTVDSPVSKRLRADGMVFVGQTTTPEWAWKAVTDSPLHGITRNPVDTRLTPGGSSGGSAVAVAAQMAPVAVGTDGGGSIRIPASFCGIVGFKPTHGRVPMYPASPFHPLAHAGPMTRTVEDAAALMDILCLPDHRDPHQLAPPDRAFRAEVTREVRGIRAAYSPDLGYLRVDDDVAAVCERAVAAIERAGLDVDRADPGFGDPREAFERLWAAGAATLLAGLGADEGVLDPGLARLWERGRALTAVDYVSARQVAAEAGITMGGFHERYDVLVTPSVAVAPFEAGHEVPPERGLTRWPEWAGFSYPFNMTQQPALSVPAGRTESGLPVGLQIVGPRHSDDLVLAVGRFVEAALREA